MLPILFSHALLYLIYSGLSVFFFIILSLLILFAPHLRYFGGLGACLFILYMNDFPIGTTSLSYCELSLYKFSTRGGGAARRGKENKTVTR